MFKHIMILAGLLALLLAGCTGVPFGPVAIGSGQPVTQEYDLAGFDAVDVSNGFQVSLAPGDGFAIKVTIDDNLTDYLVVDKLGDTLHIGLDNRGGWFSTRNLQAEVTLPELKQVGLSGGSSATMAGFPAVGTFKAELSGGSRLEGAVTGEDVSLNGSGGSRFVLAGSAQNLALNGSGGSRAELAELAAQQANVDLSGGSQAAVAVTGELNYNLSGGSRLTYSGDPAIGRSDASGGSEAVRRD